jgi:hypothetical protein
MSIAVASPALAQSRDLADEPGIVPTYIDPEKPADMVFTMMSHDFGTISDDDSVEYVFKFKNAGKGDLRIASTKGSCSCTVPAPSKREFAPGEEGEIRVIFDPKGKAGQQHQVITVNTNDAETPVISLQVEAMVVPQVMVTPRVGHFGEVAKDEVGEIELTVIGRKSDFEITGIELSDPELFEATFSETYDSEIAPDAQVLAADGVVVDMPDPEPVRECKIKITMKPGQDIGLIRNKTIVIMTNDEKRPSMTVELMAQHAGDILMTPKRITLGSIPAGGEFHREVTIRSLSGKPFKVLGIDHTAVAADAVDYSFTPIDPNNPTAYKLVIDGVMPEDARVLRGRFVLATDVEREEKLYLHYYGQQRPAARTSQTGRSGAGTSVGGR